MIDSIKMQNFAALAVLALCLSLRPCHAADSAGLYIPATQKGAQEVVKLNPDSTYKSGDKEIRTKMSPDSKFETVFACDATDGLQLTPNSDGKYLGCCQSDQILVGSEETQFRCCGRQHILAGNKDVGFSCCPEGSIFDGKVCDPPDPPKPTPTPDPKPPVPDPTHCVNGKQLVHGKCVCPTGTKENESGVCAPASCASELSYGKLQQASVARSIANRFSGKCYMFKFSNGEYFGSNDGLTYFAGPADKVHGQGVFTFCPDENCTATGPVGSNDTFFIKDLRGRPPFGDFTNYWLNNYANGNHIAKTEGKPGTVPKGEFSISKFPECGKYCLGGGKDGGLYYACPSANPALTFHPKDPGVCVITEVLEVPCDYHKPEANCAWDCGCDEDKNIACPAHAEL